MAKRVESPSSINTFKQCKRKYYYNYIKKLPTQGSIHCVRGNIVHSTLENFYDLDLRNFTLDSYPTQFKISLQKELIYQWGKYKKELSELNMSKEELKPFFEKSMMMVLNWSDHFLGELNSKLVNSSIEEAFKAITPIREKEYKSEKHSIRGFIDSIHNKDGEIHIIDYKTNNKAEMKQSIKLQLAIYALLYEETHGILPDKVGAFFLKYKPHMIEVNKFMVEEAIREIDAVHTHTSTSELEEDYTRTVTGLCKWATGQCDFYDTCKPRG